MFDKRCLRAVNELEKMKEGLSMGRDIHFYYNQRMHIYVN